MIYIDEKHKVMPRPRGPIDVTMARRQPNDQIEHPRCKECGLHIRCGDAERHADGYHHNNRLASLATAAREERMKA